MATLFMDNYEFYGAGSANQARLTDGIYGQATGVQVSIGGPADPVDPWLQVGSARIRYPLPSTYTTLFAGIRFFTEQLPNNNGCAPINLLDVANNSIVSLRVTETGRIAIYNSAGTVIGSTQGPVITAGTKHHIECKAVINGASSSFEVRTDDGTTPVLNLTGINLGSTPIAQWAADGQIFTGIYYLRDLHIWDTTGSRNTGFLGDITVATLWPHEDVETGWTPNYRHKIEEGVLDLRATNNTGLGLADSPSLEFGSGDYTVETFLRFNALPTGTQRRTIAGKWSESNNARSWQLSKCGPSLNSGNIEFRISTDGTAGTVSTIISQPWEPETDRWYNVALVRSSGETMLFIDGIMQGVPQADANTYFNGTAQLSIATSVDTFNGSLGNTNIYGWLDETRITRNVARYTVNFTPTTVPFGRNSTDDPDFADVVFLAGYDTAVADESSFARTITNYSSAVVNIPDDGQFQYQTIDQEDSPSGPPRDDTNISASYYRAAAILTLSDNPANTETVTVAGQAYTFKTSLSTAYDVLIGVDIETTLQNLAAAINDSGGEGTIYGTGTAPNADTFAEELPSPQMKVLAKIAGTAGNSIAVSETVDGSWDNSTLTGGADIPGPSSFRLTRMPPDVTTIRSVMAVTRGYKTDAGTAKMRTNFVGPNGTQALGAEVSLTTDPTFRVQVFEADPDTSGPITPSTLLTGRVRLNRTE